MNNLQYPRLIKRIDLWIGLLIAAGMIVASWQQILPVPMTETLGFVTGAACVYLVVQQNVWNFPLGIANNIFFLVLFSQSRLFGDAALQIVYIALGIQGWYQWLRGGANRTSLKISKISLRLFLIVCAVVPLATWGLVILLRAISGAAPLPDALTTVLSLAAQFLLNRKILENWWFWIVADVIYIYLYIARGLQLTAVLYGIFLCLCIAGLLAWRRSEKQAEGAG